MTHPEESGTAARRAQVDEAHQEIYNSPEFAELRSRFRRIVFPLTVAFLSWYFLYVLSAVYARDLMNNEVFSVFNIGFFFGLGQFASTFLITYIYVKRADKELDPISEELHARYDAHEGI